MSLWGWLLVATGVAYLTKLAGYLLPQALLDRPAFHELAGALTVGLLASLTVMNTVAGGQGLAADARLLALGAAGIALSLKAPYLVVVIVGAVAAAVGRMAGLP